MAAAITFQMVTPTLPKYINGLGCSLTLAGTLTGLYSISALIGRPFSGMLSDRRNKKHLVIAGLLITGAGTIGLALSHQLVLLGLCRIVMGLGFALSSTLMVTLATNYMPEDRMGEGVGYFALNNLLALSIGPSLGIWIGNHYGYPLTFAVAGCFTFLPALLILLLPYQYRTSDMTVRSIRLSDFFAPELIPYLLFVAAFSFSNSSISAFLSLFAESRNIPHYTYYFTINAIMLIFSRPFAGRLGDRKGGMYVIFPAYLICAGALAIIAGAHSSWLIFAAAAVNAFGAGAGSPCCQSECIKKLGPERRGIAVSMYYIGADVANGIAPSIGGYLADSFGYAAMYRIFALFCLVTAVIYWLYCIRAKKQGEALLKS